jgi:hypothetical protein
MVKSIHVNGTFFCTLVALGGLFGCEDSEDRGASWEFEDDSTRIVPLVMVMARPESLKGRKIQSTGYLSNWPLGVPVIFLTKEHATIGDVLSGVVILNDSLDECLENFVRIAGRFVWRPDRWQYVIKEVDRVMVIGSETEDSFICYPAEG